MHSTLASATPPPDARLPDDGWQDLGGQLRRINQLIHEAARALGMDDHQAEQAALDGGFLLDGAPVLVTPLPADSNDPRQRQAILITVSLGLPTQSLPHDVLATLLAHAPGLLNAHRATIGCSPDGVLQLHRLVSCPHSASGLVLGLTATHRLATLMAETVKPSIQRGNEES